MDVYVTSSTLLWVMMCLVQEVLTEYCGDNIGCHPPYRCCGDNKMCCYDDRDPNRHLRSQVWNMWYFWFLIIFMMMSCFGGCGYYRRRRLEMFASRSAGPGSRAVTVVSSRPVRVITTTTRQSHRAQSNRTRPFNVYSYTGPAVDLTTVPSTDLPPAYSEVVSQPGLYPIIKTELPPYPGLKPGVPMSSAVPSNSHDVMPLLYSERPPNELPTDDQVIGLPAQSTNVGNS